MSNCLAPYGYRPTFVAGAEACTAPGYNEHRSRLEIGHTFFRSLRQSTSENNISLEIRDDITPGNKTLYVKWYQEDHVTLITQEVFEVPAGNLVLLICSPDDITNMANVVNGVSSLIEMPALAWDVYDHRTEITNCLPTFPETFMTGGDGGPTDSSVLPSIRTGPGRTLIIIRTTEDIHGNDIDPPPVRKVQQWDGSSWIPYCNRQDGMCPGNDTTVCSS